MDAEAFWQRVAKSDVGCWSWSGMKDRDGYGRVMVGGGRSTGAHRVAWLLSGRTIPDGLVIDHLCRNPGCVNPDHLEVVTRRENTRRGDNHVASHIDATHCKRGHEFTPENTYLIDGRRNCRTCRRDWMHEARRRGTVHQAIEVVGGDIGPWYWRCSCGAQGRQTRVSAQRSWAAFKLHVKAQAAPARMGRRAS